MIRHRLVGAALCVAALLLPVVAHAHAHLDHASPAVGGTVTPAPTEVMIWFTEAIEPKFSSIEVRDMKGAAMHDGAAALVPGNRAQLRVAVKALPPGTYKVIWRVLSVDTHRSQGDFTFRVGR
jgi:methionine-rich copper-binding protein CopC